MFFDGDEAGRAANEKQGKYLKELLPEVQISVVETPEGEDVNSLSVSHEQEIFTHLLNSRKNFSFSNENLSIENKKITTSNNQLITTNPYNRTQGVHERILQITNNANKITYPTETATYHVKGGIPKALDSLKITLEIELVQTVHAPSQQLWY